MNPNVFSCQWKNRRFIMNIILHGISVKVLGGCVIIAKWQRLEANWIALRKASLSIKNVTYKTKLIHLKKKRKKNESAKKTIVSCWNSTFVVWPVGATFFSYQISGERGNINRDGTVKFAPNSTVLSVPPTPSLSTSTWACMQHPLFSYHKTPP